MNNTSQKIIEYIQNNIQATGQELAEYLEITPRAVRKHLKKLTESNNLDKKGTPPKVYYYIPEPEPKPLVLRDSKPISADLKELINKNYLLITPDGKLKPGIEGFLYWCDQRNLDLFNTAKEYEKTLKKYEQFKENELINGMKKFKETFEKVYLDEVFYLDFYSIKRFGKTKLGQLLLYAKQSQNKKLIDAIIEIAKPTIDRLIETYSIDAVGFIPPTVKREVQFMKELKNRLSLPLQNVSITKIRNPIVVPQKTLKKLEDRVTNAETTIIVDEKKQYENILLIDDAIGSGATLNQTAKQIKKLDLAREHIIGLAITGSLKGFEVISEI